MPGRITKEWFQIYLTQSEIQRKSMVYTAELRQIFPLRENTLRHVVEGDGRYPRVMTPSVYVMLRLSQAWRLRNTGMWEGGNDADIFLLRLTISRKEFYCRLTIYFYKNSRHSLIRQSQYKRINRSQWTHSIVITRQCISKQFTPYASFLINEKWFPVYKCLSAIAQEIEFTLR